MAQQVQYQPLLFSTTSFSSSSHPFCLFPDLQQDLSSLLPSIFHKPPCKIKQRSGEKFISQELPLSLTCVTE